MRVDESWQSQIVTEDIVSFTMKTQENKRFDYVFISVKYMIVLGKHQAQRLNKVA